MGETNSKTSDMNILKWIARMLHLNLEAYSGVASRETSAKFRKSILKDSLVAAFSNFEKLM